MGYTTDFSGEFKITPALDISTKEFLTKLATTRRMKRDMTKLFSEEEAKTFGVEGEFYVDGKGLFGDQMDESVIDQNEPPSTQPSLWCQWIPNESGTALKWDNVEKFYNYVEWIQYIVNKILKPKGYKVEGSVLYQGEDIHDRGYINCNKGKVWTSKNPFHKKLPVKNNPK